MTTNQNPEFFCQIFFGNGTGSHSHRGFTGTGTTTTTIITETVLLRISIVGMTRTESLGNVAIILGFLVGIANQQANWRTGGFAFKYPRNNFNLIRLFTLGCKFGSPRLTAVQIVL